MSNVEAMAETSTHGDDIRVQPFSPLSNPSHGGNSSVNCGSNKRVPLSLLPTNDLRLCTDLAYRQRIEHLGSDLDMAKRKNIRLERSEQRYKEIAYSFENETISLRAEIEERDRVQRATFLAFPQSSSIVTSQSYSSFDGAGEEGVQTEPCTSCQELQAQLNLNAGQIDTLRAQVKTEKGQAKLNNDDSKTLQVQLAEMTRQYDSVQAQLKSMGTDLDAARSSIQLGKHHYAQLQARYELAIHKIDILPEAVQPSSTNLGKVSSSKTEGEDDFMDRKSRIIAYVNLINSTNAH